MSFRAGYPVCALLVACGPSGGSAPALDPLDDQIAAVGSELRVTLRASDTDADAINFTFRGQGPRDGLSERAELRPYGDGSTAMFRWTPMAGDVGTWSVTFEASDGGQTSKETIQIEVRTSDGADKAPLFRRPLHRGGTVLDLGVQDCIDVPIVVEDLDTASVTLREAEPRIAGATLTTDAGKNTGTWSWCPDPKQRISSDTYLVSLEADDGEGSVTPLYYTIHLRQPTKAGCPGTAPSIAHTPTDASNILPLSILADVTEETEVKRVFFYYSFTDPGAAATPETMPFGTQMILVGGKTWGADLENPAASRPAGQSAKLYYIIVAEDNDDTAGSCDHVTRMPASGAYVATYTNPGTGGNLPMCRACSADSQCGGPADNCVRVSAASNQFFCAKACTSDPDCGDPAFRCSTAAISSASGVSARQCVPVSGTCETADPGTSCVDDSFEQNDTFAAVEERAPVAEGDVGAMMCPAITPGVFDTDWYKLVLDGSARILLDVTAASTPNLNVVLVDAEGTVVQRADGPTSNETIERCLPAGTYFARVDAAAGSGTVGAPYQLSYIAQSEQCAAPPACTDDGNEPDDDPANARPVSSFPYTRTAQKICPGDEDLYKVPVADGETVHVKVKFTQANDKQDLDVIVYSAGGITLLRCVEGDTADCDPFNGQSTDSDEYLTWTHDGAATSLNFAVRGWDGSANTYDVCIAKTAGGCP